LRIPAMKEGGKSAKTLGILTKGHRNGNSLREGRDRASKGGKRTSFHKRRTGHFVGEEKPPENRTPQDLQSKKKSLGERRAVPRKMRDGGRVSSA